MAEIPNDAQVAAMMIFRPGMKILVVSSDGRGFIVPSDDVLAQTKNGKQVLNVDGKEEALLCRYIEEGDDHVAVISKARKMLVFPMAELPEMSRGKGVLLQKIKGGLSDAKTFNLKQGLEYKYGAGTTVLDVKAWVGKRAGAGLLPPNGFPKSNCFDYRF